MPKGYVDVEDQQEFSDADFRVVDNADQSKKAKLELSGSATNTTAIVVLEGQQITTVASNTTTNIGAANTTEVSISGTTTITAFGTVQAGIYREGVFQGILTLTHNGTSLILPGGANITTAAGDTFGAVSLGSGNWRVLWYTKASGASVVSSASLTLLGQITPTSGSTSSLTSLVLTSYKFLVLVVTGVSMTASSKVLKFNNVTIGNIGAAANNTCFAIVTVDLTTGRFSSVGDNSVASFATPAAAGASGLTTASTTITVTTDGTFDASGTVDCYGWK